MLREERALDLGRDLHLRLEPRALERVTIALGALGDRLRVAGKLEQEPVEIVDASLAYDLSLVVEGEHEDSRRAELLAGRGQPQKSAGVGPARGEDLDDAVAENEQFVGVDAVVAKGGEEALVNRAAGLAADGRPGNRTLDHAVVGEIRGQGGGGVAGGRRAGA